LLELGANPAGTNSEGYSALMAACSAGNDIIVAELVCSGYGANPDAVSMLAMKTKTSGVSATQLAELRLASAKKELEVAQSALQSAASEHNADTWPLARGIFDADVKKAEKQVEKCERVMRHLDAIRFEIACGSDRPRATFETVETQSGQVAAESLEDDRTKFQEPAITSSFPAAFSRSHLDMHAKEKLDLQERPTKSPRGHSAPIGHTCSSGQRRPQTTPHTHGAVHTTGMLNRVRNRKKSLTNKKTYKPQTEPIILTAVRACSIEHQLKVDSHIGNFNDGSDLPRWRTLLSCSSEDFCFHGYGPLASEHGSRRHPVPLLF
jgi:hypothetical protein